MELKHFFTTIICCSLLQVGVSQSKQITATGDILQLALPAVGVGSTLIWQDGQQGTMQWLQSTSATLLLTHTLKYSINKTRPYGGGLGFPSGHTALAFTGAAFIQKRYGWAVGIPAYVLAGFVGYSRVHANAHDVWDVMAGAAIGTGFSHLFTKPFNNEKVKFLFSHRQGSYVIGLAIRF